MTSEVTTWADLQWQGHNNVFYTRYVEVLDDDNQLKFSAFMELVCKRGGTDMRGNQQSGNLRRADDPYREVGMDQPHLRNRPYGLEQSAPEPCSDVTVEELLEWLHQPQYTDGYLDHDHARHMAAAATLIEHNAETIQMLLDLLNPLHGSLDRQTYDVRLAENFDAPRDREYDVTVTAQQQRDLNQAVVILEQRNGDKYERKRLMEAGNATRG
jgi:hypothetical protein